MGIVIAAFCMFGIWLVIYVGNSLVASLRRFGHDMMQFCWKSSIFSWMSLQGGFDLFYYYELWLYHGHPC